MYTLTILMMFISGESTPQTQVAYYDTFERCQVEAVKSRVFAIKAYKESPNVDVRVFCNNKEIKD